VTQDTITVETKDISKSFGKIKALNGVDLEVRRGMVMALLGPNGSGKTTFVRILTTLLKPDRGWAKVAGYDVVHQASAVRQVIGLTGQYAAVDENLTGQENLEMIGQLYHLRRADARRRATELLESFTLNDAANQRVKTYSGGMRRRLDLAASLIARPPILFLDEPTTGLDPRSRLDLWEIIINLTKEGTTIFLTTQYLEEADRLANTIAVLDKGRIIRQGTSQELKACCGGDVLVQVSIADRTQIGQATEALSELGNGKMQVIDELGQISIPIAGGSYLLPEVVRRLDTSGISISDLSLRQPTLDNVFLALTGHSAEEGENEPRETSTTA